MKHDFQQMAINLQHESGLCFFNLLFNSVFSLAYQSW